MNAHTDPASLSGNAAITRDYLWLELTAAANQAFKEGAAEKAETLYRKALVEAERLFATRDEANLSVLLPVVMNISCHNLAHLAAMQDNEPECRRLLIVAFERLIGAARAADTPPFLRIACIQHLKYALSELAGHLAEQTAPEPPISAYIERLQQAKAVVQHAATHLERTKDWARCGHCGVAPETAHRPAHNKRAAFVFKRKEKP